ncbi:MAG: GldG family protein [Clostridia bacterium]|nr:GldG family protein [Clostridia bacterium]
MKKLFSKFINSDKPKRLTNKAKLKQGGYAIAITAVVVAVAVAVNILFAILAQRVNLDIDISLSGDNTLSEENVKYIKALEDKVTITVCFKREDFASGTEYVAQNMHNASDTTGSNDGVYSYYEQSLNLLDLYSVYSENITLKFVDPYDPSFSEITNKYTGITIGDILVECEKEIGGEKYTKNEILSFDDIYYLTEEENSYSQMFGSSYKTYIVSGNKLESALTSAIYKTTSDKTQKVLVLGNHSPKDNIKDYIDYLKKNNFDVEDFADYTVKEIDKEVDLVIIAAPTSDFATQELDAIDEWLYNEAKRGKGLMFFADPTSPAMPNLSAYLEEWGIATEEGVLYETNDSYKVFGDPTTNYFIPETIENEDEISKHYSKFMPDSFVVSGGNAVLQQVFEQDGVRVTTPLLVTPEDSVVIKPIGEKSDWTPDGSYDKNQHIGLIMSSEATYVDNELCTSYVCAFSSAQFVNANWFIEYDANTDFILKAAKFLSGASDDGITFTMKKMSESSFNEVVTYESIQAMSIIFQWIMPIALIVTGVVVFVRRARR